MEPQKTNQSIEPPDEKELNSLKGTMLSVGVVGAIIVIMWVAVFMLYMSRI